MESVLFKRILPQNCVNIQLGPNYAGKCALASARGSSQKDDQWELFLYDLGRYFELFLVKCLFILVIK